MLALFGYSAADHLGVFYSLVYRGSKRRSVRRGKRTPNFDIVPKDRAQRAWDSFIDHEFFRF